MSNPLYLGEKKLSFGGRSAKNAQFVIKNSGILFAALLIIIFGSVFRLWNMKPVFYAQAYAGKNVGFQENVSENKQNKIFETEVTSKSAVAVFGLKKQEEKSIVKNQFTEKIYEMVGDAPIREMVPFISKRNERVAAFLIGIAKKESSFGEHAPSLNGQTCYNYWGYKGSASRGSSMGYACFASAEEAVKTVGDRIEVLISKNHETPLKMLVWKCGSSCAGHSPEGVRSWVATVAMYFEKILG